MAFNSLFNGRHGSDQLSVFMVFVALILVIAYPFIPNQIAVYAVQAIAIALVALSFFRMVSRNTAKRMRENEIFLSIFRKKSNIARDAKREEKKRRKEDRKMNRFFKCPECKTVCRVPKGHGKIRITCPKCSHQFIRKS